MKTRQGDSKRFRPPQSDDEEEDSYAREDGSPIETRSRAKMKRRPKKKRVARRSVTPPPAAKRRGRSAAVTPSPPTIQEEMEEEEEEEASPPARDHRLHAEAAAHRMADVIDIVAKMLPPVINAVQGGVDRRPRRAAAPKTFADESEEEEEYEEEETSTEGDSDDSEQEEEDEFANTEAAREKRYLSSLSIHRRKEYKEHEESLFRNAACDVPLRYRVLDSGIPDAVKVQCLSFIKNLEEDGELKRRSWLERLLRVPFGKYTSESIQRREAAQQVAKAKSVLDKVVHGNLDAKNTLREMVAQGITCPEGRMPVVGLVGPPGIGKTTLARRGIAEVMKRPFFHISCGGMQDAASLRGHCYTWEGSTPGGIVNAVIETGVMDPVILLDEVDKLNNMPKGGADVQSVLIHLLDPTQNDSFQDEYFSGISLDLSRAIFVLSMNDSASISPVLRDRVQLIQMDTPKANDKVEIAKGFLLPACLQNVGLTMNEVYFPKETLHHAISTGVQEAGVRQLKYSLEGIVRRVNMFMLLGRVRSREILGEFSMNESTQKEIINGLFRQVGGTREVTVTAALYDALKPTGATSTGSSPPFAMYM